jgi:hypothetical protein
MPSRGVFVTSIDFKCDSSINPHHQEKSGDESEVIPGMNTGVTDRRMHAEMKGITKDGSLSSEVCAHL